MIIAPPICWASELGMTTHENLGVASSNGTSIYRGPSSPNLFPKDWAEAPTAGVASISRPQKQPCGRNYSGIMTLV